MSFRALRLAFPRLTFGQTSITRGMWTKYVLRLTIRVDGWFGHALWKACDGATVQRQLHRQPSMSVDCSAYCRLDAHERCSISILCGPSGLRSHSLIPAA